MPTPLQDMNTYIITGYPTPTVQYVQSGADVLDPQTKLTYDRLSDNTKLLIVALNEERAIVSYTKVMGYALATRHKR